MIRKKSNTEKIEEWRDRRNGKKGTKAREVKRKMKANKEAVM